MAKTPTPTAPAAADDPLAQAPKFGPIDALMTLLALTSVTLVLIDIFARAKFYAWGVFTAVVVVDAVITAIFLADFVRVARRSSSFGAALKENWFDALGLVPMVAFVWLEATLAGVSFPDAFFARAPLLGGAVGAAAMLRLFRFVRIVRVFAALSRLLRATNMTFGEAVTKRVFDKYRRIIVAELTTPILVAGITMSQEIIVRMKFLESAGKALDAKRPEIHAAVLEALKKNKVPENVITQPMVERIVNEVEKSVVDTVVATLTGPELNKLTQEMIVEVLENFKQQLASPEGKAALKGLDLSGETKRVPVAAAKPPAAVPAARAP